jgi:hypothetical protein
MVSDCQKSLSWLGSGIPWHLSKSFNEFFLQWVVAPAPPTFQVEENLQHIYAAKFNFSALLSSSLVELGFWIK